MLPDKERKVITILSNFSIKNRRMPTLTELRIKTGLREELLVRLLQNLVEKRLIEWDEPVTSTIKLHKDWRFKVAHGIFN